MRMEPVGVRAPVQAVRGGGRRWCRFAGKHHPVHLPPSKAGGVNGPPDGDESGPQTGGENGRENDRSMI